MREMVEAFSKTALVTGASSGIGRHSAQVLARESYRVALVGRREDTLRETASLWRAGLAVRVIPIIERLWTI